MYSIQIANTLHINLYSLTRTCTHTYTSTHIAKQIKREKRQKERLCKPIKNTDAAARLKRHAHYLMCVFHFHLHEICIFVILRIIPETDNDRPKRRKTPLVFVFPSNFGVIHLCCAIKL